MRLAIRITHLLKGADRIKLEYLKLKFDRCRRILEIVVDYTQCGLLAHLR